MRTWLLRTSAYIFRSLADFLTSHVLHLAITTVVTFGVTAYLLLSATRVEGGYILPIVFFAGTLGAVANNYRRLYLIPGSQVRRHAVLDNVKVAVQFYISPLIGGLFGIVLYVLFLTGIISGSLFPHFDHLSDAYVDLNTFLNSSSPSENIDAAKAIFWAFLAGFSEMLVPNILDKIAKEAAAAKFEAHRRGPRTTT